MLSWVELSWVELNWVELSWIELSWIEPKNACNFWFQKKWNWIFDLPIKKNGSCEFQNSKFLCDSKDSNQKNGRWELPDSKKTWMLTISFQKTKMGDEHFRIQKFWTSKISKPKSLAFPFAKTEKSRDPKSVKTVRFRVRKSAQKCANLTPSQSVPCQETKIACFLRVTGWYSRYQNYNPWRIFCAIRHWEKIF